jgi:hypothetical protein
MMSADVFAALRTQPEIGRVFREDEDKPGAEPVAVISHALWQNRFGRSGRNSQSNDQPQWESLYNFGSHARGI